MKYCFFLPFLLLMFCKGRNAHHSILNARWQEEDSTIIYHKLAPINLKSSQDESLTIIPILSQHGLSGECNFDWWIIFKSDCLSNESINFLKIVSLDNTLKIPLLFKQKKETASKEVQIAYAHLFDNDIELLERLTDQKKNNKSKKTNSQTRNPSTSLRFPIRIEIITTNTINKWTLSTRNLQDLSMIIAYYHNLKKTVLEKDYSF